MERSNHLGMHHRVHAKNDSCLRHFCDFAHPGHLPADALKPSSCGTQNGRQIKRLSQSSLQEYDLNNDGRLSELESARASAMIRESRNELDRYGSLLTILQFWSE